MIGGIVKSFNKIIIFSFLFVSGLAVASPTQNEFKQCRRIAVSGLENCLNKTSYFKAKDCWDKSKNSYDFCATSIYQRHSSYRNRHARDELADEIAEGIEKEKSAEDRE